MKMNNREAAAAAAFGIFLGVIAWHAYLPLEYTRKLRQLEKDFTSIRHPSDTKLVRRKALIGLLNGTGDHCDYFVGELRTYKGNIEKYEHFYQKVVLTSPITGEGIKDFQIVELNQGKIPSTDTESLPYRYRSGRDWGIDKAMSKQNLYIVFLLDSGSDNAVYGLPCF